MYIKRPAPYFRQLSSICLLCLPVLVQAQIRVMSYNIHYGVGMDQKNSLAGIAEAIKNAAPDVVGLQEIADSAMAADLGRLTGMHAIFGPSLGKSTGYGDAILSKYPAVYNGNLSIPSASESRYQAMSVTVDLSSKLKKPVKIRLINTHFDWLKTIGSQQARVATVEVVEQAFFKGENLPTMLTGDFNVEPDNPVVAKLESYGWLNASGKGKYKTIPSTGPTRQIDYIFYRPGGSLRIKNFHVLTGLLTSDHLPVIAELELTSKGN